MRRVRLAATLAALVGLAACDAVTGVHVAATWRTTSPVDALEVTTSVGDDAPISEVISANAGSSLVPPYRVLVLSPANERLSVQLTAQSSGVAIATGRIEVTPKERELPEITLELQPVADPR